MQWSDIGEAVFLFEPKQIDLIAQYARLKKKRRLSTAHRDGLVDSGRDHQFGSDSYGSEVSTEQTEQRSQGDECGIVGQDRKKQLSD